MISIIIIVKNDRRIALLLKKLSKIQKPEPYKILVIDASSGALDDIKTKFKNVEWIYFINTTGKKITIPEQRNLGIKKAKGDILIFIDSDCVPTDEWMTEIIKPIRINSESIVAGKVEFSDEKSLHNLEAEKQHKTLYLNEAPTMNIAISADVFKNVGDFDRDFACGEDVDFLWRAIQAGYKIRYAPRAVVFHDVGDFKNELRRMYVYGKARVDLYRKHRYRMKYFIGSEIFKVSYPLFFMFLPLTFLFPYYPLIALLLLFNNRVTLPYKMIVLKTFYGAGMLKQIILPMR